MTVMRALFSSHWPPSRLPHETLADGDGHVTRGWRLTGASDSASRSSIVLCWYWTGLPSQGQWANDSRAWARGQLIGARRVLEGWMGGDWADKVQVSRRLGSDGYSYCSLGSRVLAARRQRHQRFANVRAEWVDQISVRARRRDEIATGEARAGSRQIMRDKSDGISARVNARAHVTFLPLISTSHRDTSIVTLSPSPRRGLRAAGRAQPCANHALKQRD